MVEELLLFMLMEMKYVWNFGQIVTQGQTVLKVGSTGYSTGPHAHFEIRINGEYLNPIDYISPNNGQSEQIEEIKVELE